MSANGKFVNRCISRARPRRLAAQDFRHQFLHFCYLIPKYYHESAFALKQGLRIPIDDTISTVVRKSLRIAGVDTRRVSGWGSLFV